MNVHIAHPTAGSARPANDVELIALCKRARRFYVAEKKAEQRCFDADDNGLPMEGPKRSHKRVLVALRFLIESIVEIPATTLIGMGYKAALLSPWDKASLGFDEDLGRDLALSIADDARIIGTRDL